MTASVPTGHSQMTDPITTGIVMSSVNGVRTPSSATVTVTPTIATPTISIHSRPTPMIRGRRRTVRR